MEAKRDPISMWPDYFPPDCPPAEATTARGVLFRFTYKAPPTAKDFVCHWSRHPKKRDAYERDGQQCEACGLSVYLDAEHARAKRAVIPALRRMHLHSIAVANDGVIMPTPREKDAQHHTWWPSSDCTDCCGHAVLVEGPSAA